jgi:hypothetical protein
MTSVARIVGEKRKSGLHDFLIGDMTQVAVQCWIPPVDRSGALDARLPPETPGRLSANSALLTHRNFA